MESSSKETNGMVNESAFMASSSKGTNEMATLTPSPTVPPVDYVTINIPTLVPRQCLPPNTSTSPAPAADPPSHHHQLLDQAPTDQNQQPDTVVEQPGALVGQPDAAVGQPDAVVGQPDAVVGQPDAGVVRRTCEKQIINMVEMQIEKGERGPDVWKKRVAQEALQGWKEALRGLEGKVERRTKQADKLIFEIYQLVGLYSVFVGVVFTAAVQSQILRCQHIWSPVLLCAVAWLTIIVVTQKRWRKYRNLRATNKSEGTSRAEIYGQISKLKAYGYKEFDFNEDVVERLPTTEVPTPSTICGVIPFVLTALTLILDMIETTVVNDTGNDYYLKEGNGGQFRLLTILKQGRSWVIKCDVNATYREYWVGTAAGNPSVIITSDECVENTVLTIKASPTPGGRDELVKTTRRVSGGARKKRCAIM